MTTNWLHQLPMEEWREPAFRESTSSLSSAHMELTTGCYYASKLSSDSLIPCARAKISTYYPKQKTFSFMYDMILNMNSSNLFYTGGVWHSHIPSCQNIEVFNHWTTIIILQTVMFLMNSVLPSSMLPYLTFMSTRYLIRFMSTRVYTKTINTKTSHCTNSPQTCLPSKEGICDTHTCPLSMQEFDKNLKFQAGQKSAEKRKEYTTKNATEFWAKSENITCLKEEKKHSMCLLHCSRLLQPMLLETWDSSCPSLNLLPYFPLWNQILNVYLKTHFALAPKFNPDLTSSQFKI